MKLHFLDWTKTFTKLGCRLLNHNQPERHLSHNLALEQLEDRQMLSGAPIAVADTYQAEGYGGQSLWVSRDNGVLANDTPSPGGYLSAVLQNSVSHGSLAFSMDGSFMYTPNPGATGDSFTYRAWDYFGYSDETTVTINVANTNTPTINVSNATVSEGETAEVTISLSSNPASYLSVSWSTQDDTAYSPSDYYGSGGNITFSPGGPMSQTIFIETKWDSELENSEKFTIEANLMGQMYVATAAATVTIEDRPVEVSISAQDDEALEVPPIHRDYDEAIFRISRQDLPDAQLAHSTTVYVAVSGLDADPQPAHLASSSDWRAGLGLPVGQRKLSDGSLEAVYAVTIPSGKTFKDIAVQASNDHQYEQNEQAIFTLVDSFYKFDLGDDYEIEYEIGEKEAHITIVDRTADIDIAGYFESIEDDPGANFTINDDDDDNQDGVPDYLNDNLDGDVLVENDLVKIKFRSLIPEDMEYEHDYFTLGFADSLVRFWTNSTKAEEITAETQFAESDGPFTVWMESVGIGDGSVQLIWHENAEVGHEPYVLDSFAIFVWGLDLDIDSDNDRILQHSDWEEVLENNKYGLGKLILPTMADGDYVPVSIKLPPGLDEGLTIRFEGAEAAQLSTAAGDLLFNDTDYPLGEIGYHQLTGVIELRFTGKGEASHIPYITLTELRKQGSYASILKATVVAPDDITISDEVKYIVTPKPSIFWAIQQKPQARAVLASRAVYKLGDLPYAGLEWLDETKLRKLGISENMIAFLNQLENELPNGFTAALYRDYVAGPDRYVIAYAGTQITKLEDWVNNASQFLAGGSPQYEIAISVIAGDNVIVRGS